jgi:hypothetical protein
MRNFYFVLAFFHGEHIIRARVQHDYLRSFCAGDVVRDSATRGAEREIICRAGASSAIISASAAFALQF